MDPGRNCLTPCAEELHDQEQKLGGGQGRWKRCSASSPVPASGAVGLLLDSLAPPPAALVSCLQAADNGLRL